MFGARGKSLCPVCLTTVKKRDSPAMQSIAGPPGYQARRWPQYVKVPIVSAAGDSVLNSPAKTSVGRPLRRTVTT
jgi:hypothetical protein